MPDAMFREIKSKGKRGFEVVWGSFSRLMDVLKVSGKGI
jgi:hypothetical protein